MIDKWMHALISQCFDRRKLVCLLALASTVFGYFSWTQMSVEAYPELSDVSAQVTTQVPGLAAEEIEQQITMPLERALANTPGVVTMRSSSTFGLSLITLVFQSGAEDYWSRARVSERIATVSLPSGVTPSLDPVSGPAGEVYRYTLESDSKNLMELSEIQNGIVIRALLSVPGVANVDNFGGFTKEYQLEVDPQQLIRFNVAIGDIVTAINANNGNAGGGRATRGEQSYIVRGIGQIQTLNQLGDIVVTQRNGQPVFVRDLGKLVYGHQVREGVVGKDNNPDTVEGIVDLLKYQNPSKVLEGVHAKVDELQKQLAPMGVRLVPYIDRDNLVKATVGKVAHTVVEGVGLVIIILILFLGSPRAAIVAAVTIPLSLVTVFILMHFTKMPANLFSLGAIDFGVIVDGAIVVTEAILRVREDRPNDELDRATVMRATGQVAHPIFFATLIIITAYLPLFAFEHAEGKLFTPMAYTVGYALFGALLTSLVLVPALAYKALKRPRKVFHNAVLEAMQRAYARSLGWCLGRPAFAYFVGGLSLVLVLCLGARVGREFLPELDEGSLWLQVQMPSGLSLDKAIETADELRRVVRSFPEVSYIVTQVGRNDSGTDPWTPSHIESGVGLTPYETWHGETKAQFIARLDARLKQIPGITVGISQPIVDGENDMVGGAHSALVLRVYGDSFKEMRRIGNDIVDVLKNVPGTNDASIFQEPEIPQLVIETDRDAAARYGVNIADVNALIQNAIAGAPITQVYVGERSYNVTLHVPRSTVGDRDALGQLVLNTTSGAKVPLSMVAKIGLKTGESTIAHEHGKRQITIRVDNRERALSDYLADAQRQIDANVRFDRDRYHLEWAGTFENAQRAQQRIGISLLVVLGIMMVLLMANFGNVRQAVLVLGVVPLAMLGGLIALHVRGYTLNIATAVGFIALFGVAVQNGIILVSNVNRVRAQGRALREAVIAGALERFRPVLMTATVATAGMLPAAFATGVGTDVQRGLATVVVGGLAVATLLTLYILPTYYFVLERVIDRRAAASSQQD